MSASTTTSGATGSKPFLKQACGRATYVARRKLYRTKRVSCPFIPYPLIGMVEMVIEGIGMRQNVSQSCVSPKSWFIALLCLKSPKRQGGRLFRIQQAAPADPFGSGKAAVLPEPERNISRRA